jgi:hypothetical protein
MVRFEDALNPTHIVQPCPRRRHARVSLSLLEVLFIFPKLGWDGWLAPAL